MIFVFAAHGRIRPPFRRNATRFGVLSAILALFGAPTRTQASEPSSDSTHDHEADDHEAHDHEVHGEDGDDAGEHDHASPDHHSHQGHHAHRFEMGLAPGLVYVLNESEVAFGLHLHFIANLGRSRWGLGLGAERIFDEHGHTTISLLPQFRIIDPWTVILGPGITISDDDPSDVQPSVHLETAYEFMLGHFHAGPSIEVALDPHSVHLTAGLHVGFGF